jgi:hypothetical protein
VSHHFEDRGHDCLSPHNSRCVVTPAEAFHQPRYALLRPAPVMCRCVSAGRGALPLQENVSTSSGRAMWGRRCRPHPWVHSLSRGGPGGHCRYTADWVPLYTCPKSGPETRHATTRHHVSHGSKTPLSWEGSGATMCRTTLSPLQCTGRPRCCHVPTLYGAASPLGRAPYRHMSSSPEHGPSS